MCYNREMQGECCGSGTFVPIKYRCDSYNGYICFTDICYDGTKRTPYCGVGKCNIFGCNCDGGCRRGTEASAKRIFQESNPHVSFVL